CTVRPARSRIGSKADNSTFTLSAIGDGFMIARPFLLYSKRERTRSAEQSPWADVDDELPEPAFDGTVASDSVIKGAATMRATLAVVACATMLLVSVALAQEVSGSLTANGKSAALKYAVAQEVDSATEKGYMDVIVVLSDRKLAAADARNVEKLE